MMVHKPIDHTPVDIVFCGDSSDRANFDDVVIDCGCEYRFDDLERALKLLRAGSEEADRG